MKNLYTTFCQIARSLKLLNHLAVCFILLLISLQSHAQVGVGTITPDVSAQLDVSSTKKGVLIPRMNRAERDAILTPATGLLIFQTNEIPGFYFYNGTVWGPLVSNGSSVIIPFASGNPVSFNSLSNPNAQGALIGFGNSSTATILNNTIDLTGGSGQQINFAFSAPRSGTIESISASFNIIDAFTLFSPILNIHGQVFICPASNSDNVFTPLVGATVILTPTIAGSVQFGSVRRGIATDLNIPITAEDRLLLVFYTVTTSPIILSIKGYVSAGISIK